MVKVKITNSYQPALSRQWGLYEPLRASSVSFTATQIRRYFTFNSIIALINNSRRATAGEDPRNWHLCCADSVGGLWDTDPIVPWPLAELRSRVPLLLLLSTKGKHLTRCGVDQMYSESLGSVILLHVLQSLNRLNISLNWSLIVAGNT